jgi:DNA repair exonuclease SbcCD nuclease subunit
MPGFVAFSDVHAHPFSYGNYLTPYPPFTGVFNSRLVDTVLAIEAVSRHALANNIDTVVFTGDLFHTRQSVRTDAKALVSHVLKTHFVDKGLTLVMIPGNHDYADRNGNVHSLHFLRNMSDSIHVLDTVTSFSKGDWTFVAVPYTDDVHKAQTDLKQAGALAEGCTTPKCALLCHLGIQGGVVGSDFVMICPSDVEEQDLPLDKFDICLFGHYHEHQAIAGNACYVGALTQQNWGDSGGKRGFLHVGHTYAGEIHTTSPHYYDGTFTSKRTGKSVPVLRIETEAPKFLVCTDQSGLSRARQKDFVSYHTDEVLTPAQQGKLRAHCSAISVEIKPVKVQKSESSVELSGLNIDDALVSWVEANAATEEQTDLLSLGKSLLAEGKNHEI